MGTSALDLIGQWYWAILGIVGVCSMIAIVMAIVRYLAYESQSNDYMTLVSRIGHILVTALLLVSLPTVAFSVQKAFNNVGEEKKVIEGASETLEPEFDIEGGGTSDPDDYANLGDVFNKKKKDGTYVYPDDAEDYEKVRYE